MKLGKLIAESNEQQIKREKFPPACGATTAAAGVFSSATASATGEGGGAAGTSAGKTRAGSRLLLNQDSALAAKLDKSAFARFYLCTETYSQRGLSNTRRN